MRIHLLGLLFLSLTPPYSFPQSDLLHGFLSVSRLLIACGPILVMSFPSFHIHPLCVQVRINCFILYILAALSAPSLFYPIKSNYPQETYYSEVPILLTCLPLPILFIFPPSFPFTLTAYKLLLQKPLPPFRTHPLCIQVRINCFYHYILAAMSAPSIFYPIKSNYPRETYYSEVPVLLSSPTHLFLLGNIPALSLLHHLSSPIMIS